MGYFCNVSVPSGFNPRAPCGARPGLCYILNDRHNVSIHAPHAGRDAALIETRRAEWVSIHAPHAGRDIVRLAFLQ